MGYVGGRNLGRKFWLTKRKGGYNCTGRSPGSQDRLMEAVYGGNFHFALWVRARKELKPEDAEILQYPSFARLRSPRGPHVYALSNGVQTIDIGGDIIVSGNAESSSPIVLERNLRDYGVEPDGVTPRIAAVALTNESLDCFEKAWFGIVYPDENGTLPCEKIQKMFPKGKMVPGKTKVFEVELKEDEAQGIATYRADGPGLEPSHGEIITFDLPKLGKSAPAQELAEWDYNRLEQFWVKKDEGERIDTRVSAAAIVLGEEGECHIGIKNRHPVFTG